MNISHVASTGSLAELCLLCRIASLKPVRIQIPRSVPSHKPGECWHDPILSADWHCAFARNMSKTSSPFLVCAAWHQMLAWIQATHYRHHPQLIHKFQQSPRCASMRNTKEYQHDITWAHRTCGKKSARSLENTDATHQWLNILISHCFKRWEMGSRQKT